MRLVQLTSILSGPRLIAFAIVALSQLHLSSTALAGGLDGGGSGGAFVCRNSTTQDIESVELLDLFELRASGQQVAYDDVATPEVQVEAAIARLRKIDSRLGNAVEVTWKKSIQPNIVFGPQDLDIPTPEDADPHLTKEGCKLEGMMYYSDIRKRLIIKSGTFKTQKRPTEIAASYLHEAIYKEMRDGYNAKDSVFSRVLTGCLVSTDLMSCLNLKPIAFPKKATVWKCDDEVRGFYMWETGEVFRKSVPGYNGSYGVQFLFTKMNGRSFGYRTPVRGECSFPTLAQCAKGQIDAISLTETTFTINGLENFTLDVEAPYRIDKTDMLYQGGLSGVVVVIPNFGKCKVVQH